MALYRFFGIGKAPQWFGVHPKEKTLYKGSSDYQEIAVVEWMGDITLFIDLFSQFSSREEHRYHESLVHPVMAARLTAATPEHGMRVLLLGAGDGLAAREVLAYGDRVASVDLVDLDPHITTLFREGSGRSIPQLVTLTRRSLTNPKMKLTHTDARKFVVDAAHAAVPKQWDVIIVDLPDPMNGILSDLYSVSTAPGIHWPPLTSLGTTGSGTHVPTDVTRGRGLVHM